MSASFLGGFGHAGNPFSLRAIYSGSGRECHAHGHKIWWSERRAMTQPDHDQQDARRQVQPAQRLRARTAARRTRSRNQREAQVADHRDQPPRRRGWPRYRGRCSRAQVEEPGQHAHVEQDRLGVADDRRHARRQSPPSGRAGSGGCRCSDRPAGLRISSTPISRKITTATQRSTCQEVAIDRQRSS